MAISFKELTPKDKEHITNIYESHKSGNSMLLIQEDLSAHFGVSKRTIRNWANRLDLNTMSKNIKDPFRVLIYDIETSRVPAMVFWTGKTYINHRQLRDEPKIISISWKWLGEDKVHHVTWDRNHSDETLMRKFLPIYNSASMVVGYNNDKFDNKWINTRAAKHRLEVNLHVKSFDLYKQARKVLRLPSFSMEYLANYYNLIPKLKHEGIAMWDKIQFGTAEVQKEALKGMVEYNVGDILSTEEIYIEMRKYFGHKTHLGVILGENRASCPNCGGTNVEEYNGDYSVTPAGTIQRHMICRDDRVQYKISNTNFLKFIDSQ
jgi:uncharacterized protein YprB with RNaseH-like and TPR domain